MEKSAHRLRLPNRHVARVVLVRRVSLAYDAKMVGDSNLLHTALFANLPQRLFPSSHIPPFGISYVS